MRAYAGALINARAPAEPSVIAAQLTYFGLTDSKFIDSFTAGFTKDGKVQVLPNAACGQAVASYHSDRRRGRSGATEPPITVIMVGSEQFLAQ